jgi:hypothetical protein
MRKKTGVPLELMDNLLLSIVAFMAKTGMSASEIERSFQSCLTRLGREVQKGSSSKAISSPIGCDTVAGAVLRAWHRESKYLDDSANPLSLHFRRGKINLASLVQAQDEKVDAEHLVREMRRTGLVKKSRNGKYLPTTNAATIRQLHPLAIDHVAKTVMRLVETVNRNTHTTARKTSLIERYAHIPDLDSRQARAFAEFARQQGAACLEAIEDWLESRRGTVLRDSSTVSAGMHVFAYVGASEKEGNRRRIIRSPRLTPSRAIRA